MPGRGVWIQYLTWVAFLFLLGYFFYGRLWTGFLLLPLMYWIGKAGRKEAKGRSRREYLKWYGEFLQAVETALSSGCSMEHAILSAKRELEQTHGKENEMVKDLCQIEAKLQLQETVGHCLQEWADKMQLEEMRLFSCIVSSAGRQGGDVNVMIRRTAEAITARLETEDEIYTMLSGKYLEYRVMCIMPLGIIAYVKLGSPDYFQGLYETATGVIFMTVCLAVYLSAMWFGKKWMKVRGMEI